MAVSRVGASLRTLVVVYEKPTIRRSFQDFYPPHSDPLKELVKLKKLERFEIDATLLLGDYKNRSFDICDLVSSVLTELVLHECGLWALTHLTELLSIFKETLPNLKRVEGRVREQWTEEDLTMEPPFNIEFFNSDARDKLVEDFKAEGIELVFVVPPNILRPYPT